MDPYRPGPPEPHPLSKPPAAPGPTWPSAHPTWPSAHPAGPSPVAPAGQRARYTAAGALLMVSAAVLTTGVAAQENSAWARPLPDFTWALVAALVVTGILLFRGRRVARGAALALSALQSVLVLRYLAGLTDPGYREFVTEYSVGGWYPVGMTVLLLTGGAAGAVLLRTPDRPRSRGFDPYASSVPHLADRQHRRAGVLALLAGLTMFVAAAGALLQHSFYAGRPYLEAVSVVVHPPGGGSPFPGSGESLFLGALLGVALATAAVLLLTGGGVGRGAVLALSALSLVEPVRYVSLVDIEILRLGDVDSVGRMAADLGLMVSPLVVAVLCIVSLCQLASPERRLPPPPPPPWPASPPREPRDAVPHPAASEPSAPSAPSAPSEPSDAPPAPPRSFDTEPRERGPILGDGRHEPGPGRGGS